MKKRYKYQKEEKKYPKIDQKVEPIEKDQDVKIINTISIKSPVHKITTDSMFPLFIIFIIFSIIIVSYGIWASHAELDKNITIKVSTSSNGEYVVDECGNIYSYYPISYYAFDVGSYYSADLIKYPNYDFKLLNIITNYHKINESEYIKNCN